MEEELKLNPLMDHLLLQQMLSNLTLSEVKVARLVCHLWRDEGTLNLRQRALSIHLNPPHLTQASRLKDPNLEIVRGPPTERLALRDFLTKYKLTHTLHLSLLDYHPWLDNTTVFDEFYNVRGDIVSEPFSQQHNNYNFAASLLTQYLPQTAPFIKELRLELMLKQDKDFKMLEQILEVMEGSGLEVFSLDIAILKPEILEKIELSKDHKASKIKTLAIRLNAKRFGLDDFYVADEEGLDIQVTLRLLSLFPNVSFLDLVGWRMLDEITTIQITEKTNKLLDAAIILELKFDGIHVAPQTEADYNSILNYCKTKPLKSFYLNVYWGEDEDSSTFETFEEILMECEPTLERFDLTWRPVDLGTPPLSLPPLHKLKSLTYASKFAGISEPEAETKDFAGETLQDVFGFKELFADSGKMLHLKFPALESLSLILVGPGDGNLWGEICPPENDGKCISSRIHTLVVTFAGECESEEIQKIPRTLFPKVKHFRHGKWSEDGDKFFVCHHEYDAERRLSRKWSWLAAVKHFIGFNETSYKIAEFGNYFWTIREKFRLHLGDEGFWDTGYDIEATGLHYSNINNDDD